MACVPHCRTLCSATLCWSGLGTYADCPFSFCRASFPPASNCLLSGVSLLETTAVIGNRNRTYCFPPRSTNDKRREVSASFCGSNCFAAQGRPSDLKPCSCMPPTAKTRRIEFRCLCILISIVRNGTEPCTSAKPMYSHHNTWFRPISAIHATLLS